MAIVARADLTVPVLCDGVLEAPPGGELRAPAAAVVARIFLSEGGAVRIGESILRLDSSDLVAKALSARALVSQLHAERESAAADLRGLEREAAYRRGIVESDERLLSSGALTRSARDADEISYRQTAEKLAAARDQLRAIDGAGAGDGSGRLALAERAARDLEARVAALTLRAPSDGRVYGLPLRAGEAVVEGQPVASVIDPRRRRVRARVDPPDLPRVAVGQRLTVRFDGLPDERWEGVVDSVDRAIRPVVGREVAEVVGEVPDPESRLPANASVNVEIIVGEKRAALVIPRAALYRDGSRRFVYLRQDARAVRREILLGLLGTAQAEVLSGLREGERVLLPGPVPLRTGLRVDAGP